MADSSAGNTPIPWVGVESSGPVLVLVRHGRTAWNAEQRFLGQTDLPLDDVGASEVEALGARIGGAFDAIYSSPLRRALQTAEALGPLQGVVPAITELNQGVLEGLGVAEGFERYRDWFREWADDPEKACVPGGESLGDVRDRAVPAVLGIARAHERGVIAVVTHQMVIAAVCCHAAGAPLRDYREYTVPNLAVSVLRMRGEQLEVAAHGRTV
ncbi:MAG: histidine phosphatase family protein [Alphaproteobacteria bacterium]|nr:histidine phosphatase family protein [Alphaproteobacteria bacterium]